MLGGALCAMERFEEAAALLSAAIEGWKKVADSDQAGTPSWRAPTHGRHLERTPRRVAIWPRRHRSRRAGTSVWE